MPATREFWGRKLRSALSGALLAAIALTLGSAGGCALYRNDRAYVDRDQYQIARDMFVRTGSLDLVERQLHELQWQRAQINEAIYRLEKEFQVLPEEVPPAAQPAQ